MANTLTSLVGNKADGTGVATAAKCPGFPKKNETVDFTTPYLCE